MRGSETEEKSMGHPPYISPLSQFGAKQNIPSLLDSENLDELDDLDDLGCPKKF